MVVESESAVSGISFYAEDVPNVEQTPLSACPGRREKVDKLLYWNSARVPQEMPNHDYRTFSLYTRP